MINWKSVEKDGMPEKSGEYLTYNSHKRCRVISFSKRHGLWNTYDSFNPVTASACAFHGITHWTEINLPES